MAGAVGCGKVMQEWMLDLGNLRRVCIAGRSVPILFSGQSLARWPLRRQAKHRRGSWHAASLWSLPKQRKQRPAKDVI